MAEAAKGHESYLELCAGSAVGALGADDQARLDEHLAQGCSVCQSELDRCRESSVEIAESLEPVPVPDRVKETVFARIRAVQSDRGSVSDSTKGASADEAGQIQPWREWSDDTTGSGMDLFLKRSDDGDWEDTGVDGILVRSLFVDRANNRMTALFRMSPGAEYIPHVHAGYEECFVLEGDLKVGDTVMQAGDYQRAEAGSTHGIQSTKNGCLLLISSSLSDEAMH